MRRNRDRAPRLRAAGLVLALAAALLAAPAAHSLVLDDSNRLTIVLDDGTQVSLIGEASSLSDAATGNYYYLPANLRLSMRPDNVPEFLFLKYTSEARADQGGVSGGILHLLMEWGLTPQQEADLAAKLKQKAPKAVLKGAVPMEPEGDSGSFQIVSASLSDKTLAPSVVTSGKAPLVPGGKAAAAARLTPEGAQLLAATFEKARSITDLSLTLNYSYVTLAPAARGSILLDWSKLERESESLRAKYKRQQTSTTKTEDCFLIFCASSSRPNYTYSYDEVRKQYKFLEEQQIVQVRFDELIPDERVAKIREAFLQFFVNSMAKPADPADVPPAKPADAEKEKSPDIRYGDGYTFNQSSFKSAFARKTQRFDLNYRMAVRWPFQLVGNMGSWYDGVRDNPKCVATVNLNDPFFQHRDIHFILDLDAKEMFDQEVNYVTVNVRKQRSSGNPFEDRVTLDAKYLKEKGIAATVTYARGEDQSPDAYEYAAQWSLKGGNLYPPAPGWQKGTWEGVTLAPPVVPRTIELEGDLESMKANGITRVTAQVHYLKFGQEVEDNLQLSATKGEPVVTQKIFMDRGVKGYAYRLIVNHKTEGKLALPWSAQVGDDYIYAVIPPDLLTVAEVKGAAKEAAKNAATSATEKILDQFKELTGGSR